MTDLRPYQQSAVDGVREHFRRGRKRVLLVLPTGGGKGRIIGNVGAGAARKGKRVIAMAHRAELVDQICRNLDDEGVPYSRIQPGHAMVPPSHPYAQIRVGMVQTITKRLAMIEPPDLLLVDEAHHSPASQYTTIATAWQRARQMGLTATPTRKDGTGLSECFDQMVVGVSTRELIDAGYLAAYDYYSPSPSFTMGDAALKNGEYVTAQAMEIVQRSRIVGDAVEHYRRILGGKRAVVFCLGIEHCLQVVEQFSAAGITAAHVDGMMPMPERTRRMQAFERGEFHVLVSADVISEGVDIPAIQGVILLRPTGSLVFFLQSVGRALRPKADGSRAIILDHVNNAHKHGYPADFRHWSLDGEVKHRPPPIVECKKCFRSFPAAEAREQALASCFAPPCPIHTIGGSAGGGGAREAPELIAGDLIRVVDPWQWAGGIDPVLAAGQEYRALLDRAQGEEQLRMIARARGYHPRWVRHVLIQRADQRGKAA